MNSGQVEFVTVSAVAADLLRALWYGDGSGHRGEFSLGLEPLVPDAYELLSVDKMENGKVSIHLRLRREDGP